MENKPLQNGHDKTGSDIMQITEDKKIIRVKRACIDNSYFEDICATSVKITDANLSDLEIDGAQLGGAYIHNIGMPPKGYPAYDSEARQRPLRFDNADLHGSTITNCNLSNLSIDDCNVEGMKINGILVEDLLKSYQK
jgi:uncharacterized protein YjbI with pentapeptide repeats